MKDKNVPEDRRGEPGIGDVWTWTAHDPDSKLMCSWLVGGTLHRVPPSPSWPTCGRGSANRVQITTDGHPAYLEAIEAVRARTRTTRS